MAELREFVLIGRISDDLFRFEIAKRRRNAEDCFVGKSLFPTLDRSGKSTPDIDSLTKIRFVQVLFAKLLVRNRTDIEKRYAAIRILLRLDRSENYCG